MSKSNNKKWSARLRQIFGLPGLVSLVPLILFAAHFARGVDGDHPYAMAVYAIILIGIGVTALLASKFKAATPACALAAAVLAVWVGAGLTGNWYRARADILALAAAGAIFLTGRLAGQSTERMKIVWHVLIVTLTLFSVLALISHFNNYTGDPLRTGAYVTTRLHASFVSPNTAATLFAVAALIAMGQLLYTVNHADSRVISRNDLIDHVFRRAFLATVLFVLATSCLWLTSSRAGIAAFAIALIVLIGSEYRAYRQGRRRTRKTYRGFRWAVFIGALAFGAFAFYSEILNDRALETASDVRSRFNLYLIYWEAWQEKPWFGHGLGSFNRVNDALMTLDNVGSTKLMGSAHNIVLQWLIQQGIVGTGVMLAFFIAVHVPIIRAMRTQSVRSKTFLRLTLCVSGLVILHGMVDYALEIPSIMWTYTFLLGLAHGRSTAMLGVEWVATDQTEEMEAAA